MAAKMGRPKVDRPKINLTIRLDPDIENRLQKYCDEKGISRGEAVRQGIELLLDKK